MKKSLIFIILTFSLHFSTDAYALGRCPVGKTQEQCCKDANLYPLAEIKKGLCENGYKETGYSGCYTCDYSDWPTTSNTNTGTIEKCSTAGYGHTDDYRDCCAAESGYLNGFPKNNSAQYGAMTYVSCKMADDSGQKCMRSDWVGCFVLARCPNNTAYDPDGTKYAPITGVDSSLPYCAHLPANCAYSSNLSTNFCSDGSISALVPCSNPYHTATISVGAPEKVRLPAINSGGSTYADHVSKTVTFTIYKTKCLRCNKGYFADSAGVCQKCSITNCDTCSSATSCAVCTTGYTLSNGSCVKNETTEIKDTINGNCPTGTTKSPDGCCCIKN